jgi:hypothetical protein
MNCIDFHGINQLEQKEKKYSTSLVVALQWKILVIPLWISSDLPSMVKTDERIVLRSLRAKVVQDSSPPSLRLLTEFCRDPIDSEISATASWRAHIRFLLHKGWINCKSISHHQQNFMWTYIKKEKFLGCHISHFVQLYNLFSLDSMINHDSIHFMASHRQTYPASK